MIPFRKSLVFRIFLISFILLALPLLVDSFVIIQSRYSTNVEKAKHFLIYSPSTRIYVLSHILQVREQVIDLSQEILGLKHDFPKSQNEEFNKKLEGLSKAGGFEKTILLKKNENKLFEVVSATFPDDDQYTFFSYSFFEKIANREQDRTKFSFIYTFPDGSYHVLVGKIIEDDKGQEAGMFMYVENVTERLQAMLAPTHGIYDLHYALLLNNSVVVASEDPRLDLAYFFPINPDQLHSLQESFPFTEKKVSHEPLALTYDLGDPFIQFDLGDMRQIGVITSIPNTDFLLLCYTREDLLFINPFVNFFKVYLYFGLILLIGGSLAYFLSRRISKPFRDFSDVMESIKKGELSKRYTTDPLGFEINALGLGFNQMIEKLLEKKTLAGEEKVKVEIYDKELRIGQQIQRGLLPSQMPSFHGVEIAEKYLPAKEVGGDFFDVFVREIDGKEQLVLIIADASGKGVHACFYSLGVRSHLRVFARVHEAVSEIMKSANHLFYEDSGDTGMFVTVLMGIYDPETMELSYCSCGHNAPLLRRKNGETIFLEGRGMAMGVNKEFNPVAKKIKIDHGDLIAFYTDGITENHDENNKLYSDERLLNFIKNNGNKHVMQIGDELMADLREFQGSAMQHDDITLLLMKLL